MIRYYPPEQFLTPSEFLLVQDVARELCRTHLRLIKKGADSSDRYGRTLGGLCAEFAAVKYFKYHLGYTGELQFNTDYPGGFDGGWDFAIEGVKFDVKYDAEGLGIKGSRITRPFRADIFLYVTSTKVDGKHRYRIGGFLPSSRVPESRAIVISPMAFVSMYKLTKAFPGKFQGAVVWPSSSPLPESVSNIVPRSMQLVIDAWHKRIEREASSGD